MTSGWFIFSLILSIVLCSGLVLAAALMRASWMQREREALTSTDLTALEESAVLLIDQLKSEADRAVAELDERREQLNRLMEEADRKLALLKEKLSELPDDLHEVVVADDPVKDRVRYLASKGMDSTEIARTVGLDCAEVKLILSLSRLKPA